MFRRIFALTAVGFCSAAAIMQPVDAEAYFDSCCDDYDSCCCDKFWFDAEYLYWQIKDSPVDVPFVIDQPVRNGPYTVVLGDKKVDNDWRSGGRFTLGYWFDDCCCYGGEANYFFLGNRSKRYHVSSDANGSPRLRVPYYDVVTGMEDSIPLATPGLYQGTGVLKVKNSMQGAEVNMVASMPSCGSSFKFGLLAGFRWWNFDEELKFFANSPIIDPPSVYNYYDKFNTRSNFYGGQIGGSLDWNYCSFFLNATAKVALGAMCQKTNICGHFETNEFNGTVQGFTGGFFALPTNIGHHSKTQFSVLPEVDVKLGYQVSECFRVQVGYTFLYASNVLFAGKQIDRRLNPTQSANIDFNPDPVLVGEPSPKGKTCSEGFWAQGVSAGIEFRF